MDRRDPAFLGSAAVLSDANIDLVVPTLVIAEVCYFLSDRLGTAVELEFVRWITTLRIEPPVLQDWPRIAELVERYADFPLGTVDASVIALAERLDTPTVITLDRRHFGAVRPRHCEAFEILPTV